MTREHLRMGGLHCLSLVALAVGLLSVTSGVAEAGRKNFPEACVGDQSMVLRIAAYNIQGLPFVQLDRTRYKDIGQILAQWRAEGKAPHVLAMQEAFETKVTNDVWKYSKYPYRKRGPAAFGVRSNAGLEILSEFPIGKTDMTSYQSCLGVDCLARKGALGVEVKVPGLPQSITVFGTHMNASYSDQSPSYKAAEPIRKAQLQQANVMAKRLRNQVSGPSFFVGDFNFSSRSKNFNFLEKLMGMFDSAEVCTDDVEGCDADEGLYDDWLGMIDHIFYTPSASPKAKTKVCVEPISFRRIFTEDYNGRPLSDHAGLAGEFRFVW